MTACSHKSLLLLSASKKRLRCRHCHLTIAPEALEDDYCPECYEVHGQRRYDFDTLADGQADTVRYRCEDCGIIIDV
jgi:hypothetical protein